MSFWYFRTFHTDRAYETHEHASANIYHSLWFEILTSRNWENLSGSGRKKLFFYSIKILATDLEKLVSRKTHMKFENLTNIFWSRIMKKKFILWNVHTGWLPKDVVTCSLELWSNRSGQIFLIWKYNACLYYKTFFIYLCFYLKDSSAEFHIHD